MSISTTIWASHLFQFFACCVLWIVRKGYHHLLCMGVGAFHSPGQLDIALLSWLRELVWADCTSCGSMNAVTIITSQLWDEEVAWLSKAGISSYTTLSSSLAVVPRSGWRILITACWLDSRRKAQILLKTHQKVEKYWQRELMMPTLKTSDCLHRCLHNYLKHHLGANWDTRKMKQTPWMEINN